MTGKRWTENEIEILKQETTFNGLGQVNNHDHLKKVLPLRTDRSIHSKINRLRKKKIFPKLRTEKQIINIIRRKALVVETGQIINMEEICKHLKIKKHTLELWLADWRRRGIFPPINYKNQFDAHGRHYSESEDNRIIYMRKRDSSFKEIADSLGRTPKAIQRRVNLLKKLGKFDFPGRWLDWEEQAILDNVTFDENGFVNNYPKLQNLLQCRRSYKAIRGEVVKLRKQGLIKTMPKPGTTSIKALEQYRKFNEVRFAERGWNAKKRSTQIIYAHQLKKPTSGATEVSKSKTH